METFKLYSLFFKDGTVAVVTIDMTKFTLASIDAIENTTGVKVDFMVPIGVKEQAQ